MITVHGRTRCQFYKGTRRLDCGARGQGQRRDPGRRQRRHRLVHADATAALAASGADAVMIGRGAQGRPWLPGQIARYLATGSARGYAAAWRHSARSSRRSTRRCSRITASRSAAAMRASISAGRSTPPPRPLAAPIELAAGSSPARADGRRSRRRSVAISPMRSMPSALVREGRRMKHGMEPHATDAALGHRGRRARCAAASGDHGRRPTARSPTPTRRRRPSSRPRCRCCAGIRCSDLVPFGSPLLALIDQVRSRGAAVNEYKVDLGDAAQSGRAAGRSACRAAARSGPATSW